MIEAAWRRNAAHVDAGKAEFLVADVEGLELGDRRFDKIFAVRVRSSTASRSVRAVSSKDGSLQADRSSPSTTRRRPADVNRRETHSELHECAGRRARLGHATPPRLDERSTGRLWAYLMHFVRRLRSRSGKTASPRRGRCPQIAPGPADPSARSRRVRGVAPATRPPRRLPVRSRALRPEPRLSYDREGRSRRRRGLLRSPRRRLRPGSRPAAPAAIRRIRHTHC
jgi:hypothetical protein